MKIYSYWGYDEFIICAGYKQHIIKDFFSKYVLHNSDITFDFRGEGSVMVHNNFSEHWKVTVINTGYETLTGGRIKKIQPCIDDENFLLTYGDGVADINVNDLVKFHKSHGKICTITAVKPEGRFGAMKLDGDRVLSFREKSISDVPYVNGGFMVMQSKIFDYIEGDFMLENEPFDKIIEDDEIIARYAKTWGTLEK